MWSKSENMRNEFSIVRKKSWTVRKENRTVRRSLDL